MTSGLAKSFKTRTSDPVLRQLRETRLARGLRTDDVAEAAGFTRTQVSDWEVGAHEPGLSKVTAWANALGFELRLVER